MKARVLRIPVRMIYAWRPKVEDTLVDVREGRLSYSSGVPMKVSRLDSPRGGFFVVDGHHRVVEAVLRGDTMIAGILDEHVPRIERTGGAFRSWLEEKVNVASFTQEVARDQRRRLLVRGWREHFRRRREHFRRRAKRR